MEVDNFSFVPQEAVDPSREVLVALAKSHRHLGELKGCVRNLPNPGILLTPLALREATESSAIENIVTTQDALYKRQADIADKDAAAKEVYNYARAVWSGHGAIRQCGALTLNIVKQIQSIVESSDAGFRRLPGTQLKNSAGEIVYEPPPPHLILPQMDELEKYINTRDAADPIIKMAVIHHRFEFIHPFYDGNGRTGRIINALFLVLAGVQDAPVFYLSRYINRNKNDYYRLLRQVTESGNWNDWLLYMAFAVADTARQTVVTVNDIAALAQKQKSYIRKNFDFYSQDLTHHLFERPYTKIGLLQETLKVSRPTAARYLDALAGGGVLIKRKSGKENYYVHRELVDLLADTTEPRRENNSAPNN